MTRFIIAEKLKYKRTIMKKVLFLSPLLFMLVIFLMSFYLPKAYTKKSSFILMCSFNWWTLFLPLTLALFVSLIGVQEKKVANYNNLICRGIRYSDIWISKIIVASYYVLIMNLELAILIVFVGITLTKSTNIYSVFLSVIIVWMSSLFWIPLYLYIEGRIGAIANIIIGFFAMLIGAYFADSKIWVLIPFTYGLRMLCPILKVHPNSVPLPENSYLLDFSVVPIGLFLSILFLIFIEVITLFGFKKVVKK